MEKREPNPDYKAMTEDKWQEFDETLKDKLTKTGGDMQVEVSVQGLETHLGKMDECLQQTIKEVVPPQQRIKFDGRKASEQTRVC